ncbi:cupin domain-containing protein [Catalinimonas alkaloidigena]|nr:cupin domain-containing protein [Catalinimonas alkaloidigena]
MRQFIGALVVWLASMAALQAQSVRHLTLDTMATQQLSAGITRRMASGNSATFGYFTMQRGAVVPLHHHPNEQYTFILQGSVKVTIQEQTYVVKAGEVLLIPAHVPHRFECLEDGTIDLDFFAPQREDWINGTDQYFQK